MKFSAQEEYGLRCLLSIAEAGPDASLTIPEISQKEGLSSSHVAKLLSILRRAGYVQSTRGQQGGYALSMPTDQMILRDLLECLGGRLYGDGFCARHSGNEEECVHTDDCRLRPLWMQVQSAVDTVLDRYTVADVLRESIEEPLVRMSAAPRRA